MTLSIILLDDEPAVLDIFREAYGGRFDVRTAETLSAARRLLAEGRPDVVISDQVMPEISGTEFLQEVADRHPSCYRVILTGSLTVWGAAAEISSGLIHFFLPKPWDDGRMSEMFERARLHQQSVEQQTDSNPPPTATLPRNAGH